MTLASVGGGAATKGSLVKKMPMLPGLGGVWRPLVALIRSKDLFVCAKDLFVGAKRPAPEGRV
jgi:hypothetical protein